MEDRLKSIIDSNADLEEYFSEYSDNPTFLYHYFKQDLNRILGNNYLYHGDKVTITDQIKLAEMILEGNINYDILNRMFSNFARFAWPKEAEEFLKKLFVLIDEGKIDVDKIDEYVRGRYYRQNPLKALEKDVNNIIYVVKKVNKEEFIYIIDRLSTLNYEFSNKEQVFLSENVFNDIDNFIYFVNKAKYNADVFSRITYYLGNCSIEELHKLYHEITDDYRRREIMKRLNHNNYDINSIIRDAKVYLLYDNNKDQIMNFLKELNNIGFTNDIILQMPRVDLTLIDEAYEIVGDKLKISPIVNQNRNFKLDRKEVDDSLPFYDVDQIKRSEKTLDMYAASVNDTLDKDGELKSLSPLEKYAAAYLLVTKFAPYNKEGRDESQDVSRAVYELINPSGKIKIVCAGYANLLLEILHRMGFKELSYWSVVGEEKESTYDDHARIIIHLNDPKYGVDGVYMADPTWDSHELNGDRRFRHMLMSHDELLEIDNDGKVTLENLHADDTAEMSQKLGIDGVATLFRKPIPKEALMKAYLAVERFLDKNMKMSKDGNYSKLELFEMAYKMGFKDLVSKPTFEELINMPRRDMLTYLELDDDLRIDFLVGLKDLSKQIKDNFKSKGINIPFDIALKYVFVPIDKSSELFNDLINSGKYKFEDGKKPRFIICEYDENKSLIEDLPMIEERLIEFQELVDNLSSNIENNRLK